MNAPFSSRSTQAAEGLPRRRFTVAEIEAIVAAGVIDEDERFELIGGELFPCLPRASGTNGSRRRFRRFGPALHG